MRLVAILVFCSLIPGMGYSEDSYTLPPITVEGSSTDLLQYDPVVPARTSQTQKTSGSGNLTRELSDRIALPVTDYGTPGSVSQFRGIGRTVEDTNVQSLGIPLNLPQGGGFDFSAFPQFIWSQYRYQLGPQSGGYDPRATSGTLTLVPWTYEAIRNEKQEARVFQLFSQDLTQTAVGIDGGKSALMVGMSTGLARGVSGSKSSRVIDGERFKLDVHYLGTSIKVRTPGSVSFRTPHANQKTVRLIPVLQSDLKLGRESWLKTSVFHDRNRIETANPEFGSKSHSTSIQYGLENALASGPWRAGLSGRKVSYLGPLFPSAQRESFAHSSLAYAYRLGKWTIEPKVQADHATHLGVRPGGGLGARLELTDDSAAFSRVHYAPRLPSLVDRFFFDPAFPPFQGFRGNPALAPEKTVFWVSGHEIESRSGLKSLAQVILQYRQDVQIASTSPSDAQYLTVLNRGTGRAAVVTHELTYPLLPELDIVHALTLTRSDVSQTGQPFPYLPKITDIVGVQAHDPDQLDWAVGATLRSVGRSTATGDGVPHGGYALLNLDARKLVAGKAGESRLELLGRVENVLGRTIEITRGYEVRGRVVSLALSASL